MTLFKGVILFICLMFLNSCGSDSDKDVTEPTTENSEPRQSNVYNSFEELSSELLCDESLNNYSVLVLETNTDYTCLYKAGAGVWQWTTSQKIMELVASSSSKVIIETLSSSSQMALSLSSSVESLATWAGNSCNDYYETYASMLSSIYTDIGSRLPAMEIKGTSTQLMCIQKSENNWVWTIVEKGYNPASSSSSSSSFVFGQFTDPRDGQTYQTIGVRKNVGSDEEVEEIWFTEDLKYKCSSDPCLYTWQTALKSIMVSGDLCSVAGGDEQGLCPDGWIVQKIGPEIFAVENLIKIEFHEYGAGYWDGMWATRTAAVNWIAYEFIGGTYTSFDGDCNNGFITGICNGNESAVEGNWLDEEFRIRCVKYEKIPSTMSIVDICDVEKSNGQYWVDYEYCKVLNADSKLKDLRCRCKT